MTDDDYDIKDSGKRSEFETGAVRDIQSGKGRFDLLPWDTIWALAKHFEKGCEKYGDRNWEKGIPLSSGLGGDSSDAATTLRGLNRFWGLGLSREKLHGLAQQLGSDVAFFLYGGTALVEARGEVVTELLPLPHLWVVLAMPPVPVIPEKTKQLYSSLGDNHYTDGQITQTLVDKIRHGGSITPDLLFNTFENVAFTRFSGLKVAKEHMVKMGAEHVHLAGSGPALFTLIPDIDQAEELCVRLAQQRLEPYFSETLATTENTE